MNVPLLRKVQEQVRNEPLSFMMQDWGRKNTYQPGDGTVEKAKANACGTTACIGGWATILKNPSFLKPFKEDSSKHNDFLILMDSAEDKAQRYLGLSDEQAHKLFFTCEWPEPFRSDFNIAQEASDVAHNVREFRKAQKQMAKIASDYIDAYVAANGLPKAVVTK